jgi:Skp family chaperone for outer membrane proteins
MTQMMKLAYAALVAAPLALAAPAAAQVATANLDAAVGNSQAMTTARSQIQTTYKTQIDALNARQTALQGQLQPLVTEFNTLRANPATPQATLQTKAQAIQQRQEAAQRELSQLATPFERPAAYAQEQVAEKLEAAVRAAMAAKNVTLLVKPDSVMAAQPAADLTADITAQLNNTVKTVSITPPAGWQPGQQGAAPAAAAPAAAAPATPAQAPRSR